MNKSKKIKSINYVIRFDEDNLNKIRNIAKSKEITITKYCRNLINLEIEIMSLKESYNNYYEKLSFYYLNTISAIKPIDIFKIPDNLNEVIETHFFIRKKFEKNYSDILSELNPIYLYKYSEYSRKFFDKNKIRHSTIQSFLSWEKYLIKVLSKEIDTEEASDLYYRDVAYFEGSKE